MAARRRSADEWRGIVAEWLASGRSTEDYARSLGVNPTTLGWWRWKLGQPSSGASAIADEPGFAEVVVVDRDEEPVVHHAPDFIIELGDLRVRVAPGFHGPELRRLLGTLC